MANSPDNKDSLDLSSLDFGPAWAKDKGEKKSYKKFEGSEAKPKRGDRKFSGDRNGPRRPQQRRDRPRTEPRQRLPLPESISASIMPVEEGIDNLAKQIVDTGRTYSVFDLARVILKSRDRYNVAFTVKEGDSTELFQAKADGSTFLTKQEVADHFSNSEQFSTVFTSVEVEVDAPSGNFPTIACCGFTGEVIAPPNYHGYQEIVAQRHSASFANMSLEHYKKRISSERNEEKVTEWLESMKKQTKYQLTSDTSKEFATKAEAVKHFLEDGFAEHYLTLKKAFVKSDVPFKQISSGLSTGLLEVISDQNKYPGELSSFLCRQLSGRHLAVYKWMGKLHAGPSRPHAVAKDLTLADRPSAILKWSTENSGGGIDQLWKAVLPTDVTEEQKLEWYHDLHWMLNQGFLVLLENGKLHLSSDSKNKPTKPQKKQAPKAKTKKPGKETPPNS